MNLLKQHLKRKIRPAGFLTNAPAAWYAGTRGMALWMIRILFTGLFIAAINLSCHPVKKTLSAARADSTVLPMAAPIPARDSIHLPPPVHMNKTDAFLENLLKTRPDLFEHILANRDSLKVQVIYTTINRNAGNQPSFTSYYFNVNEDNYFYPASTVKMPVAVLALQRLNELKVFGLNRDATMLTESNFSGQTAVNNDPTTPDGRPTIAQYIRKIFLVSDNDAFNRLYEFLGQQYINKQFRKMGYPKAEVIHRLALVMNESENRHTNAVNFFSADGKILYTQPVQWNKEPFAKRNDIVGKAYITGDSLVKEPMDFSKKNRLSLTDLNQMLRSILFPESVPLYQRFNLTQEDYRFLWKCMSQFPAESVFPEYDSSKFQDAYGKFLLYGAEKEQKPANIRIFNKSGNAYGFLTDVAYIVDFEKDIEFMLSATVYCNKDEILNDDKYDYDSVGFPFMKNLGRLVYEYELTRERPKKPDLSVFKLDYDSLAHQEAALKSGVKSFKDEE